MSSGGRSSRSCSGASCGSGPRLPHVPAAGRSDGGHPEAAQRPQAARASPSPRAPGARRTRARRSAPRWPPTCPRPAPRAPRICGWRSASRASSGSSTPRRRIVPQGPDDRGGSVRGGPAPGLSRGRSPRPRPTTSTVCWPPRSNPATGAPRRPLTGALRVRGVRKLVDVVIESTQATGVWPPRQLWLPPLGGRPAGPRRRSGGAAARRQALGCRLRRQRRAAVAGRVGGPAARAPPGCVLPGSAERQRVDHLRPKARGHQRGDDDGHHRVADVSPGAGAVLLHRGQRAAAGRGGRRCRTWPRSYRYWTVRVSTG